MFTLKFGGVQLYHSDVTSDNENLCIKLHGHVDETYLSRPGCANVFADG